MPDFDDPRIERAMMEMERDMEKLDENNPKHMAHMMKKMKEVMPPGTMPKEMDIAIKRLEAGIRRYRVAIMCSEEKPWECHRRELVGRALIERGWQIAHIRGDGRLQNEVQVELEALGGEPRVVQTTFLEEPWKSSRSVSRRRPPLNSSAR